MTEWQGNYMDPSTQGHETETEHWVQDPLPGLEETETEHWVQDPLPGLEEDEDDNTESGKESSG